ncbi:MAG TPA: alpha/beta hydrolase [Rhodospirillales bacterium]|jgi:arylformamidase|nr:alpha/beta hydrolase [Rhodospirillales bacterium]
MGETTVGATDMGEVLYRGYDRAGLDAQYDNRAKVPGFEEYNARRETLSEEALATYDCHLEVPYGPSAAERLDVFPAGRQAPVQVFFHGGYWMRHDKRDYDFIARAFVPAGAAFVNVGYGLVPSVSLDELVRQCRAALTWVWRNADSFGGDRMRIFASGNSAGGHLAAMMATTDWPAFDADLPADLITGTCGISGIYDLEPIRLCFLNDTLGVGPGEVARLSPIALEPRGASATLLAVGDREGPEFVRQAEDLAAAWRHRGAQADVRVLAGIDHFSILVELEDPASALSRAIHAQMGLA